jgi:O-antigen/teichoic acid export membrane protein
MLKAKIIRDTALLNAAGIVSQVFAIGQRLLVMRYLDPSAYGVWMALSILLSYSAYVHLGLEHGMGIRLPYYRGAADSQRQREIETTVFTAWTALALLLALGVSAYALLTPGSTLKRFGLLAIAAMIPFEQQSQFFVRWQTSAHYDFATTTRLSLLRSVALLIVVVPLVVAFGIYGMIAGTLLVSALVAIVWHLKSPFSVRWVWSVDVLRELLRIGFPMLLVILAGSLIEMVDRMLILFLLGTVSLGYYGVTGLGGSSVYGFLAQAGSAMSPHMAAEMGRSADAPSALGRYLLKPTLFFATAAAFFTLSLMFIVPLIVRRFIPHYAPGIPAFYAYVPGFFFLAIIITANNIVNLVLIARKRQRMFLYVQGLALICEVGFGYLFIRVGWGIVGVAAASTLAYALYGGTTLILACTLVFPAKVSLRFIADVMTPIIYCGAIAAGILWTTAAWHADSISTTALQLTLYAVGGVPLLLWLNRRAPFFEEALQLWRRKHPGLPQNGTI